jgi:hypothetical protein
MFSRVRLVEKDISVERTASISRPQNESIKHLWNVGQFLPEYTTQHPVRRPSLIRTHLVLYISILEQNGVERTRVVCIQKSTKTRNALETGRCYLLPAVL